MKEDLLKTINNQLDRAYQLGQSFYYFKRDIHIYLSLADINYKEENLELVYNTFLFLKYSAENYKTNIAVVDEFPYWQYDTFWGLCKSELCRSLDEKVFLSDDQFWTKFYPPNHPGCGASINPVTIEQFKNKNLQLADSSNIIHPYPEWAFNPVTTDWRKFFNKFIVNSLKLNGEKNGST